MEPIHDLPPRTHSRSDPNNPGAVRRIQHPFPVQVLPSYARAPQPPQLRLRAHDRGRCKHMRENRKHLPLLPRPLRLLFTEDP
jgi:hypothetical protein